MAPPTRKSPVLSLLRGSGKIAEAAKIQLALTNIKRRCRNPRSASYPNYGGRGILICEEWSENSEAFYQWAVLAGHAMDLSLDRIDPDGDYSPGNCRWADVKTQLRNQRRNHLIDGVTIAEWCERLGVRQDTMGRRASRGLTKDRVLFPGNLSRSVLRHGTRSGYETHKCRCQECTKCNTQRAANYRITRRL